MNRAVFFDRDGTLIEEKNYLSDVKDVNIFKDAFKALRLLKDNGFKIIIVSNQSGVARGYFSVDAVEKINKMITDKFMHEGVKIDGVYYCPHYKGGTVDKYCCECNCRKPKIGMAEAAVKDFKLDLKECFMVGDKESDVEFGINFGAKATILVNTGYGSNISQTKADYKANSLYDACCMICGV